MMNYLKTTFFILSLLSSINFNAQNRVIDSLKNKLLIHKQKDTIRVNILNELAYLYRKKKSLKAVEYLIKADSISKILNYKKGEAENFYVNGLVLANQSKFDLSLQNFKNSLHLFKKLDLKKDIIKCNTKIGLVLTDKGELKQAIKYFDESIKIAKNNGLKRDVSINLIEKGNTLCDLGDYKKAIDNYKKSLTISKEFKDEKIISRSLNNIGNVYSNQGNYPLALEYYNESLLIDEKLGDTKRITGTLNNLGIIYKETHNYKDAINTYKKALKLEEKTNNRKTKTELLNNLGNVYKEIKEYQIALEYLKEALKLSEQMNNKLYIATILNNLSDVYLFLNKNEIAFQNFEKAKKMNLEVENLRGLCNSYLGLAKIYTNQKKYKKALIAALKSNEISTKLGLLNYQRDVQKLISNIYKNIGNYKKSLIAHQQFKKLNDSIFNKKNIKRIAQLENEYKHKQELISAQIRELQLADTLEIASKNLEKSKRNLLLGVILFLIVALALVAIIFFLKLRNAKTKTQNIIIEQKLLRSQMTPHFIFNSLSVLQGMILNKEEENSISYLSKFSKLLRTVLENSRHKKVLLTDELEAIESFMALQNLDMTPPYKYTLNIDPNINKSSLKIPPMLIQPFIENAIEHAFPNKKENKEINIELSFKDEKLFCTIEDNGIGINTDAQKNYKNKNSLATTITSERLKMLSKDFNVKGSLSIKNRKLFGEQGTLVTLEIPYKTDAA